MRGGVDQAHLVAALSRTTTTRECGWGCGESVLSGDVETVGWILRCIWEEEEDGGCRVINTDRANYCTELNAHLPTQLHKLHLGLSAQTLSKIESPKRAPEKGAPKIKAFGRSP